MLFHLAALAAGSTFICTPAQVWDGDTFTCADGKKIRVSGIAAREVRWNGERMLDAGCGKNHPCPTATGVAAREYLARLFGGAHGVGPHGHLLVKGPLLQCRPDGPTHGRIAAWCSSGATGDISCRMVQKGYALKWQRYWKRHVCR